MCFVFSFKFDQILRFRFDIMEHLAKRLCKSHSCPKKMVCSLKQLRVQGWCKVALLRVCEGAKALVNNWFEFEQ